MSDKIEVLTCLGLWKKVDSEKAMNSEENERFERFAFYVMLEFLSYCVVFFAVIWTLLSLCWDYPKSDIFWFQRSGAILVAASLLAEFLIAPRRPYPTNFHFVETSRIDRVRRYAKISGFVLAALGTVIWAYGDLPFRIESQ